MVLATFFFSCVATTAVCRLEVLFAASFAGERVRELLNVTQLDSVFETWLPEDLEIRVSGAEKRSHLRQESSFATLHSSLEELFESTPLRLPRRRNWL